MRERLEFKANRLAVILTTAWPLVLGLAVMTIILLAILPVPSVLPILLVMLGITVLTCLCCVPMYLGTYLFLPASEYKGARIIARLGRSEAEISGVSCDEIIVKQNVIEKALKVCHIRQKGSPIYFRGVPEPEKVKAWIEASFPVKSAAPVTKKKGRKK